MADAAPAPVATLRPVVDEQFAVGELDQRLSVASAPFVVRGLIADWPLVRAGLESAAAARTFGQTLVWIGIGMLALGILYHVQFMRGLRSERGRMKLDGLIHGESSFPVSLTLLTALALLALGIAAIVSMTFRTGPLG